MRKLIFVAIMLFVSQNILASSTSTELENVTILHVPQLCNNIPSYFAKMVYGRSVEIAMLFTLRNGTETYTAKKVKDLRHGNINQDSDVDFLTPRSAKNKFDELKAAFEAQKKQ